MAVSYTYVIGDIGGHADALLRTLYDLGADRDSLELPDGVTVVSVGDLIDRGPNSLECLEIAHRTQRANPERFIQLVGNHEANWLEKNDLFYSDSDPAAISFLREWAAEGALYLAAFVAPPGPPTLITHAGLTYGLFSDLGAPSDPALAAERINDAWSSDLHPLVARPGMILGYPPSASAGVYWADAGYELIPQWLNHPMPFSQIHGHSSIYDWAYGTWTTPANVIRASRIDAQRRHVHTDVSGRRIVGVDPVLGNLGTAHFTPLRLNGTAKVAGSPVTNLAWRAPHVLSS